MDYKIIFSVSSYIKLKTYIEKSSTEISGYAKITKQKDQKCFYIEDVVMLPQIKADSVFTLFNNGEFYDDLIKNGHEPSEYKCWWHSHVWMQTQWSAQDLETINDKDLELPEDNWFVSIVGNKFGKFNCRLDIWDPIRLTFENIPWEIDFSDKEIEDKIEEEIKTIPSNILKSPFDKSHKICLTSQEHLPQRDLVEIPDV